MLDAIRELEKEAEKSSGMAVVPHVTRLVREMMNPTWNSSCKGNDECRGI